MKPVLLSALVVCCVVGCGKIPKPSQVTTTPTTPTEATPAKTEPKIYTREEFTALLVGKTQDQVIKLVGKPNRTSASGERSTWDYYDRTRDTIADKIDHIAFVWFRNGVVERVNY